MNHRTTAPVPLASSSAATVTPIRSIGRGRRAVVVAGALALMATGALSAAAAGTDSGFKSCNKQMEVKTRAYSNGTTTHTTASGSFKYYNGAQWRVTSRESGLIGTFWSVSTTGSLDAAGTYAYCAVEDD